MGREAGREAGRESRRRVLVIGLDGLDIGFATQLMDAGELPALRACRDRSARFLLDHGPAARTGLAWEHFASGLTPEAGGRTSVVSCGVIVASQTPWS